MRLELLGILRVWVLHAHWHHRHHWHVHLPSSVNSWHSRHCHVCRCDVWHHREAAHHLHWVDSLASIHSAHLLLHRELLGHPSLEHLLLHCHLLVHELLLLHHLLHLLRSPLTFLASWSHHHWVHHWRLHHELVWSTLCSEHLRRHHLLSC